MNEFKPTHKIIADGEEILVQEFDGDEGGKILMTKGEFDNEDTSDWTINIQGELEFQGSINYPYRKVSLARIQEKN